MPPAAGVRQKDIAEKVGLTQPAISQIVGKENIRNLYATEFTNSDLTVTAKLKANNLPESQVNATTPAAEEVTYYYGE